MTTDFEGYCPVCGEMYFDYKESELRWDQLDHYGSNSVFTECVRITRGPVDGEKFKAECFGHTYEQTVAYRDDSGS